MKITIPVELKREFQKACIDKDTKLSRVVCALIEGWLEGEFVLDIDRQDDPAAQQVKKSGQGDKT